MLDSEETTPEPQKNVMDNLIRLVASLAAIATFLGPQLGFQYTSGKIWIVYALQAILIIGLFKNDIVTLLKKAWGLLAVRFKKTRFKRMRPTVCALLDEYARWTISDNYRSFLSIVDINNYSDPLAQRIRASMSKELLLMARSGLFASKDPFVGVAGVHSALQDIHRFIQEIWRNIPAEKKNSESGKQFMMHYNEAIKKARDLFGKLPQVEILGEQYMDTNRANYQPKQMVGYYFHGDFEFLV